MSDDFLHIVERRIAISRGHPKYFTGRPCKNGHYALRYTTSFACIACMSEKQARDADKKREYDRAYRAANKEKLDAKGIAWKKANPDKTRKMKKEWKRRNHEYVVADAQKRRAMKRMAGGSFTAADLRKIFSMQRGRCANCCSRLKQSGRNKYHVDHIMPLARGGSNQPENLQLLCPHCNLAKSSKDPIAWANENGKLL